MSKNLSSYEHNQRIHTLSAIIWIVLSASFVLGLLNLTFETREWESVIALFSLTLICFPLLWLNIKGHYTLSALILSLLVLTVINVNLFDGDGIHDSGILGYPIFIMVGTLFFGKRASPFFALSAILSLVVLVTLEIRGYVHPTIGPTRFDILIPIVILIIAAAAFIWVVVGNIEKNIERVEESEDELIKNYDLTLEAWAKVLEYRDRETEGHSRRLVKLSTRLARAIGSSEEEITTLRRGALLHDIGKMAIPDEILLKPGPLNKEERKILEQHPAYAKQMLSHIPFLQPAIEVAYGHHEHWDGLGYPEGLKGEQIPLPARIFAIVDQWDALTSDRPYRTAWAREDVIVYIKENKGKIYDPRIVEVFLTIV
jgi:putative nucleotidyltransferase with HDIG domain